MTVMTRTKFDVVPLSKHIGAEIRGLDLREKPDDENPNRDQVNRTEAVLKKLGKTYEFHRYDGAGHAFFNAARPAYRPEQALDGWNKVFAFFRKHLAAAAAARAA